MKILKLCPLAALMLGGCSTLELPEIATNAATLQQAVATDHKTAIAVLTQVNAADLPYRIAAAENAPTFSAANLYLLDPADIDHWDTILTALDSYCAAVTHLAGGTPGTDFQTAAQNLGSDIQSLAKTAKLKDPRGAEVETAVIELGSLVIRYQGATDARTIVQAADPAFQTVIRDLIGALGFAGEPPAESAHGILAAYEADFETANAENAKAFQGGTIAGFAALGSEGKRARIQAFIAWQAAEKNNDSLVAGIKALAAALAQAGTAHAALAHGTPEKLTTEFDQLKTEIQNVKTIEQKLSQG